MKEQHLLSRFASPEPVDRRGVARRLRMMGISITEVPTRDQERVRVWARTLTVIEVEYVAETSRAIDGEDEDGC
ncbi:MAG: hypothetical protein ACXVCJ_27685 [Polyangiales bacterium]